MEYPVVIIKIPDDEGGGYLSKAPDLFGCISDGDTMEAAVVNIQDAIREWIIECNNIGRPVPIPGSIAQQNRNEQVALLENLREYDNLDERLTELSTSLEDLHEKADEIVSWVRFSDLTSLTTVALEDGTKNKLC